MPLYEYECEACGHRMDAQQRLADAPLKKCPACGKNKLQKLISATTFTLKGGGWYKDLYASQKPGSSESAPEGKGDAKSDSKSETKTESKSESKSETKSETKSEPKSETKSEPKTKASGKKSGSSK